MSYEPKLIIEAGDLNTLSLNVELKGISNFTDEEERVIDFLYSVLKYPPIEFEDSSFYICQPELTSFNADVREFLDEFNVYYKTFN